MRDRETRTRTIHDAHKTPSPSGDLVATRRTTTFLVRTRWGTRPGCGCVEEKEEEARLEETQARAFPRVPSLWSVCVEGGGNVRVAVVLRDRRMLRCALNGLDLG